MTERRELVALVSRLKSARVLVVGDVMVDHFQYGKVDRISPEAPIPVLKVDRGNTMLGGAGNVVRNLRSLNAKVRFVTVTGSDSAGRDVARMIKKQKIQDKPLIEDGRTTTTKTRYIAGVQQILRADHETSNSLSPKVEANLIKSVTSAMKACSTIVLSDYGKGALSSSACKKIIRLSAKSKKIIIVDPKGTDFSRYSGADLITPNRQELSEAVGFNIETDTDVVRASKLLIKRYNFGAILTTRSADGMSVVSATGLVNHLAAEAQEVFDVSGAGDTVVATVAATLAIGENLNRAAAVANAAAGIVVGKVGTASVFSSDLLVVLKSRDLVGSEAKVMSLDQIKDHIKQWRQDNLSLGFTNGCFDLLHPGHISTLEQASILCDRLVVGLNSDSSIKALKGDDRPIQSETSRATVLASLSSVDAVITFSDKTPLNLIKLIKPNVLVKGADYKASSVIGANIVKKYGGNVIIVDLKKGHSTSATIANLSQSQKNK
jgi:D-beta-D-heptose 7-phosphate kinase/D-beta-D-heptose 1-phosphate adenosyltransferase